MSIAHPGHAKIYTEAGYATRSTSLVNNYFVKSGEAAKWMAAYKDRIQENLNAGKTQFSITADNATYPVSIYGIQNGIIAYVMNTTDWYVNGKKVDLVAQTNGAQFDFTVPCTEDKWDAGVITTKATCTKDGVKTYTCRDCKTTKTEVIKTLGHDYSSSWTVDKAATCTNEGSKSHYCTRCDSKKDVTVIPKISHSWDKGTIVKNSTYSETGVKRYICTKCGTTKDESIAKLVDDRASILYKTHVQDIGWQGWKSNGTMSGTSGQSKRLEAIRIKLSGEIANKYDVYYRVHCQDFGWLGWAKNGEASGSEDFSKRLEGIEIRLVKKKVIKHLVLQIMHLFVRVFLIEHMFRIMVGKDMYMMVNRVVRQDSLSVWKVLILNYLLHWMEMLFIERMYKIMASKIGNQMMRCLELQDNQND